MGTASGSFSGATTTEGSFTRAAQLDFLERGADRVAALSERQALALAVERASWAQAGEFARL